MFQKSVVCSLYFTLSLHFTPGFHFTPSLLFTPGLHFTLVPILPLVFFLPLAFSLPLVFILTGPWSYLLTMFTVTGLSWECSQLTLELADHLRTIREKEHVPCTLSCVHRLEMNAEGQLPRYEKKNKPNVISTDLFCWQTPEFVVCHL